MEGAELMTEEDKIRIAKSEYMKEYRKKNKERIKAITKRYWTKKFDTNTKGE